jgi:hypothetical protein
MEKTSEEFERNEFYSNELDSHLKIQDVARRRKEEKQGDE